MSLVGKAVCSYYLHYTYILIKIKNDYISNYRDSQILKIFKFI